MTYAFSSTTTSAIDGRHGRPVHLGHLLLRAAEWRPNAGAQFVTGEAASVAATLSYPQLLEAARRLLAGLQARNLPPGAKIILVLERAEDFLVAFWGSVLGGYVPCALAPIKSDGQRWSAHLSHVNALFDRPLAIVAGADDAPGVDAVTFDALRGAGESESFHRSKSDDIALLVLTSGSTGAAKAVALTHANLLASLRAKAERQALTAADVTLNWISFDHVAALIETHLLPTFVGAEQIHVDSAAVISEPLAFLRLIERHKASMTFTPNFLLGQIVAALDAGRPPRRYDLSSLRRIICGGEAVVVDTARAFLARLAPHGLASTALWPAFGMTETCAGSVYSREFPEVDRDREFASLGRPLEGLQMRIVDVEERPTQGGASGELQLRGPMVFSAYFGNEEATRAAFTTDGWFRTGDLGSIDNGRLNLVGRSKDSIIVNGANYFGHELETALEKLDGVTRSFVAAFPTRPAGADTEQLVVAFAPAFPFEDEAELYRLIVAIRNETILLWGFRPALVLPLPCAVFPKTSLGKIQRGLMRKRLETGEYAAWRNSVADLTARQLGGFSPAEGPTETAITEIYAEMFGIAPQEVSATSSFFDLGGTSLDILKLKRSLERHFDVGDIAIVTILRNPTARLLAARIDAGERPEGAAYDPIVPLQLTGKKTPLFCVHPGVGEVLVFVNLAKYFVNERPFYALRARGFNKGERYFERFAEMVSVYVEAIRKVQPHGPYAVAGYSYGGAVAFEIAKVLEAAGERVDFVGSFNLPPHIKYRMDELDPIEGAVNLAFFLSIIDKKQADALPAQLRAEAPNEFCARLIALAPRERLEELDLDLEKFTAWAGLAQSLIELGRAYAPSGAVESLSVFYAIPLRGTKERWLNQELRRWDEFARSANRYIDVEGEHYTLMGPKHIASFQATLRAELDRALGGN